MTEQIPKIHVSKIDAAKRQLEMAVDIHFHKTDPVSMHTLVAAAHEILHVLCEAQGIKTFIKGELMREYIREGKWKEYIHLINEPQNFFKHGRRDAKGLFEFNPRFTECLIMDACLMYQWVTTESPKPFKIFLWWFFIQYPELLKEGVYKQTVVTASKSLSTKERPAFYRAASAAYDFSRSRELTR